MNHHAYIYEGPQELMDALVRDARELFGFKKEHDPDVRAEQWEKFGIDDAQQLKEMAQLKSASGRALYVLGIASITSEAQQALLKLFEEPQVGSVFVLLMPHGTLLPTLRSRLMQYPEGKLKLSGQKLSAGSEAFAQSVVVFLKANSRERSAYIAALLKDEENQKERIRSFLKGLEVELSKYMQNKEAREGLEDIAKVRSYAADRSASLKMLLEHLAAMIPSI
ncbi:MAG: hypothetical protein KGH79_03455 [Patescibacteria group bacterium]|nr:hypothetical protein [Patescibacteria group bacterium]